MKFTYKATRYAAYIGYATQAVVNNYAPLLFVTFSREFGLSLEKLSILITMNFGVQILMDLLFAKWVDKLGYRKVCVAAHVFAAMGLCMYGVLPFVMNPFAGILIANVFCAIGGGIDEVVISPVVEALPSDSKAAAMSLLHSFYCWGQVVTVAGSTLFFVVFGLENWRVLSFIWAIIPLVDVFLFSKVPILELNENVEGTPLKTLFKTGSFWLFLIIMICSGASELSMSQWASLFAEQGLHVNKTMGDLLGPCFFAVLMGSVRTVFGIFGEKMDLRKFLFGSGVLCVISYMIAVFSPYPVLSLFGCALCGMSVGLMWPGTFSLASAAFPMGGAAMFGILALAGDIGCTSGPTLAGLIGDSTGDIKKGLLTVSVFPLLLAVCMLLTKKKRSH